MNKNSGAKRSRETVLENSPGSSDLAAKKRKPNEETSEVFESVYIFLLSKKKNK